MFCFVIWMLVAQGVHLMEIHQALHVHSAHLSGCMLYFDKK